MNDVEPTDDERPLPRFFIAWRDSWGETAKSWTVTDYLNQDFALPAVIAAGRLFNPDTVEYRGGVFLTDRFESSTVDKWIEQIPDGIGRVEAVVNQVSLFDFFANCNISPFEDDLARLAVDIAACWSGVLTPRYPTRVIHVRTDDGRTNDSYGPSVSFWTAPHEV